jgi:hypothetical protein
VTISNKLGTRKILLLSIGGLLPLIEKMPAAGFKRSRALWDEARHPRQSDGNIRRQEQALACLRAICYELQPVRFSQIDMSIVVSTGRVIVKSLKFLIRNAPNWFKYAVQLVKNLTRQQWLILAGVIAYYLFVRLVHEYVFFCLHQRCPFLGLEKNNPCSAPKLSRMFLIFPFCQHFVFACIRLLDAGPLVLILTALVAIFTMGLGDEDVNNPNRVSAYSVFNRGFQRIMGSVDVDSLVAQHVGGGMMIGALGVGGDDNDDDGRHDEPFHAVAGLARRPRPEPHDDDDYDFDENGQQDIDINNNNNNNRGGARKSGKKARRRNLEQRRDAQRQREAAVALGVQVDDIAGTEEMIEIQRLIEEQIAAEQQQNGQRNN